MNMTTLALLLALLADAPPAPQPAYGPQIAPLVEQAREAQAVDGMVTGAGAHEGGWHRLAQDLIRQGTTADFEQLLREQNPAVQAMGLYCLARTQLLKSVPVLRRYSDDRTELEVFPLGCVGQTMTLGGFAQALLRDVEFLEASTRVRSLLPPQELLAGDLPILVNDSRHREHPTYARSVYWTAVDHPEAFSLEELTKNNPKLERYQIVKAVGRAAPCDPIRAFLIQCLRDPRLDNRTRLAAASALTRDNHADAAAAVRDSRPFLLDAIGAKRADLLLKSTSEREALGKALSTVGQRRWGSQFMSWSAEDLKQCCVTDHPMAIEALPDYYTPEPAQDAVYSKLLLAISARLDETADEWNTYSTAPMLMNFALRSAHLALPPDQRDLLLDRIAKRLADDGSR